MREDLLQVIKSTKDITNALILTHNIDFVFIQSVVLPALRKCGSPALTIFADAECATRAYQYQCRILSNLGRRYRVVPVAMRPGFRFHPKALLLSGPNAAHLLVGSGNLTFGGWRENGEVWSRYGTDADGTGALADFREYVRDVVRLCAEPREAIDHEVEEAFDPGTRSWAASMEPTGSLPGRAGHGDSMLARMKARLGSESVDRIYICAPYFDEDAEALRAISRELGEAPSSVFVQNYRTNLTETAAAKLGAMFELRPATFHHHERFGSKREVRTREAFLHAKFYAVKHGERVSVFVGSANCSRAALTIPGSAGNAELMAHTLMTNDEFERQFLDELVTETTELQLTSKPEEKPLPEEPSAFIRVHSARLEFGRIHVVYESDAGTEIRSALMDAALRQPSDQGEGWAVFKSTLEPRRVTLIGLNGGAEVRSLTHWIDHEQALRASARGRSLAKSIHDHVRSEHWDIGAWTEVLSEVYKHLQYVPKSTGRGSRKPGRPIEFEWGDVFSDAYGFRMAPIQGSSRESRITGLRALLLRWYGIAQPDSEEPDPIDVSEEPTAVPVNDPDDGDDPDRPVKPKPPKPTPPKPPPATERERKKALKVVGQVAARIADPQFLSERTPELLAADLKVASVLFRAGLADGWVSEQEFFEATMKIWLPLFFNAGSNETTGWLEQRYLTSPDPEEFAESVRSVELAAALGCWAMSAPATATSAEHARFELASVLGVARLPWLWQTGGNEQISKEIAEMLVHTSPENLDWNSIERRWLALVRRGYALNRFEMAVKEIDPLRLRKLAKQEKVVAGELLWQGRYGFCVATRDCDRTEKQKGEVLILQQGDATKVFVGSFLVPVAGLLEAGGLSDESIPAKARTELKSFIDDLRVDWTQH